MIAHLHDHHVDGCYRCELSRDEMAGIDADIEREAQDAWIEYRNEALRRGAKPGQLRKRAFIAGYIAGAHS